VLGSVGVESTIPSDETLAGVAVRWIPCARKKTNEGRWGSEHWVGDEMECLQFLIYAPFSEEDDIRRSAGLLADTLKPGEQRQLDGSIPDWMLMLMNENPKITAIRFGDRVLVKRSIAETERK